MDERIIYGQAWIHGDKLLQDQIKFTVDGTCTESVVTLVENIWDDLSSAGTYKSNDAKNYFYWEYTRTKMDDDSSTVTVRIECPRPKPGLFEKPYDPESVSGDYAKHWVSRMKSASENGEKAYTIQKKEVLLRGTTYMTQNGELKTIEDITVENDDLGDITNLLNLF